MHRRIITTALTAVTFAFCASGAEAAPVAECDLVAAPGGSDSAAGTADAPLASAPAVVDGLEQGQTGCFAEGTYEVGNYKISKPGITLTSLDDADATIRGRVWVEADNVTLEELILNNKTQTELPSTITGDNVVLRGNEITNDNSTICFTIGSASGWGRAYDTLIEDNAIHHCGRLPASNFDHGLYVEASTDAVIRNNWIYQNADRGIQLYPDAVGTLVEGNVIDRNGQGIIFGGDSGSASSDTIVRNNLITNSRLRDNVESYYDQGDPVGRNNLVTDNCISGGAYDDGDGGIQQEAKGFDAKANLIESPDYENAQAGDYTVEPGTACAAIVAGEEIPTEVSLKSNKKSVRKGHEFRLKGGAVGTSRVNLMVENDGVWTKVDSAKVRNGEFQSDITAKTPGQVHYKAVAADTESGAVAVRVRR